MVVETKARGGHIIVPRVIGDKLRICFIPAGRSIQQPIQTR